MSASESLGRQFHVEKRVNDGAVVIGLTSRPFDREIGAARDGGPPMDNYGNVWASLHPAGGVRIDNIGVPPEHQGRGVGKRLYREASDHFGGQPVVHQASNMTKQAKAAVDRLASTQPGLHKRLRGGKVVDW